MIAIKSGTYYIFIYNVSEMVQLKAGRLIVITVLCMVFIKIYQHNLIIRLSYERQRLELKKSQLKKQKSDLLRLLCFLKDPRNVTSFAKESLAMDKLKFSQAMTFTGF